MSSNISLTFPDGAVRRYPSGITAADVASSISPSLAKKAVSATLAGAHWDLRWPITRDCMININVMADDRPALELIRHSLAHVMARAVQDLWPDAKVAAGPVTEFGWFYDFAKDEPFALDDLEVIESRMKAIISQRDSIRTEIWPRQRAEDYFRSRDETYKCELLESIPTDEPIRMYWHGDWQDLCRGPHLQHIGQLPADAFKLTSTAGAFWRGDARNPMLTRIHGIGFRSRGDLKKHLAMLEEARKRDHRRIGTEQDLFHFQPEAPGLAFWHPHGWTLYRELRDYMSRRQAAHGYVEVNTPSLVDRSLWEASGHWEKFQEHMFTVRVDREEHGEERVNALKPMNCPCHVQIYNSRQKSYRDLPLRMAEFGSCTRFEPSGALHGLLRVRGFVQDDAHIFCEESQIESETAAFIAMLSEVYSDLGFPQFKIKFADRPPTRAGTDGVWDKAEKALVGATEATGHSFELNPGEGAFYGPKLEFVLTDAIGRDWQCGTLQVDFVLPERLDAFFVGRDGNKHRPVMLHRAILGSFERFIGILIENHSGRFPLWLAPRQLVIATVVSGADTYATEVFEAAKAAGLRAEIDLRSEKINYKIREHSTGKVPIIIAVGEREASDRTVSIRRLGTTRLDSMPLAEAIDLIAKDSRPPDLRCAP